MLDSNFTHRVRCGDPGCWPRAQAVYWLVLDALWDEADSFELHEPRPEHRADLEALQAHPGVFQVATRPHTVGGRIRPGLRPLVIRAGRRPWMQITLRQGERPLIYDEDGGDTMKFAATPELLDRLAAAGVTPEDLIDLGPSNRRMEAARLLMEAARALFPGGERFGWGFSAGDSGSLVRLDSTVPGGERIVVQGEIAALDAIAQAPEPATLAAELWQRLGPLPAGGMRWNQTNPSR